MIVAAQRAPMELELHRFSTTTERDFKQSLAAGDRYVVYHYALSALVYTFQHPTKVRLIKAGRSAAFAGWPWTLLTCLGGWWAFPFGPLHSLSAIGKNLKGGTDVSGYILEHIRSMDPLYAYGMRL